MNGNNNYHTLLDLFVNFIIYSHNIEPLSVRNANFTIIPIVVKNRNKYTRPEVMVFHRIINN